MRKVICILCGVFALIQTLQGQDEVAVISPDHFDAQQRVQMALLDGWMFHEGSDTSWSQANVDPAGWKRMNPTELTTALEGKHGRVEGWFRIKFELDLGFDSIQLSLDRGLWAATDIYLNGELICSFGETGTNRSDFEHYNPNHKLPVPVDFDVGQQCLLAMHFVNYEGVFTPRNLKLEKDNLIKLIHLTGPDFTKFKQDFRRSSYIHSTFWVTLSMVFMILFWVMYLENTQEKIFKLIAFLSVANFLTIVGKSMTNLRELSFAQEEVWSLLFVVTGALANALMLMVGEWIFMHRSSILSKALLVSLPLASVIASVFNFSAPFAVLNAILTGYFIYLIVIKGNEVSRVQWTVVFAMFLFLIFISIYVVLAKIETDFFLQYGNLLLSIALFVPLISLLVYVSMRFKEIVQDRINIQLQKAQQLEAINVASSKFVPSTFLNFLGKENILDANLGDYMEKQVSVLFSDIRDYTSLSEKMMPKDNFRFVKAFNQRMGPIIRKHNGFVNQYLGDGIMAIFPENMDDTLMAAVCMQRELGKYNVDRVSKGKISIRMGIGIHAGPLIMGIIGDEQRMDAATISDTVNTASRIEGLTKYFGVNILLSENCVDKLLNRERYNLRFLGKVQVKGREGTINVYECFDGDTNEMVSLKRETGDDFQKGVELYMSKVFKEAEEVFGSVLARNPLDGAAQVLLDRINHYGEKELVAGRKGLDR